MTTEFHDRHIAITGASGGLGAAVVEALLGAGAICHAPMAEPSVPAHVSWAGHERAHITCGVDLAGESAVESYYRALPPIWASIHLVGGFAMAPLTETRLADLDRMLALNVKTCFLCCREAVRSMRASNEGGRIVNVAARPVLQPAAGMVAYTASKAAVAAMTQALAAEVQPDEILVNAIVPSIIDTPANRKAMPDADFAKWPKAAEIAESIAFLVSPRNRLTSGALVPVYGRA